MFHNIPAEIQTRMEYLEKIDKIDREDGTARLKRLRQIPPETGKFLAILAANCPKGNFVKIGTSAGYSTMWLSLAAKEQGFKIKTFELLPEKIVLLKETFKIAKIEQYIDLIKNKIVKNGLIIADNAISHYDSLKPMIDKVMNNNNFDCVIVPIGRGELICRRVNDPIT